ncbi:MAG: hypothetical protein H0V24_02865 [Chloroflexia bacterium]|nr:hypothetical protein [Chloroflexia bacterium]
MDRPRMDALARALAKGSPRRRLVAALATTLPAWALGVRPDHALAGCKKAGRSCDRNSDCCDHAKCKNLNCRCKDDFSNCDGKCKKLDNDEKHCGRCDNRCRTGEHCCDGDCTDRDTDERNCGSCGRGCDEQEECVGGACVLPANGCPPGFDGCAGDGQNFCGATDDCRCQQSVEGATVCIDPLTPDLTCGQCTTNDDCATIGAGAVCVQSFPGGTCCTQNGGNFCAVTCAT